MKGDTQGKIKVRGGSEGDTFQVESVAAYAKALGQLAAWLCGWSRGQWEGDRVALQDNREDLGFGPREVGAVEASDRGMARPDRCSGRESGCTG